MKCWMALLLFKNKIVTGCVLFEKISHTVLFPNDRWPFWVLSFKLKYTLWKGHFKIKMTRHVILKKSRMWQNFIKLIELKSVSDYFTISGYHHMLVYIYSYDYLFHNILFIVSIWTTLGSRICSKKGHHAWSASFISLQNNGWQNKKTNTTINAHLV